MGKIIDSTLISLLNTLTLRMNITLKNSQLGSKKSTAKGSSVEFSDYKNYAFGDDFRRIDWHAYARFEKVLIKLFMEEQEASITLLMDQSLSMSMFEKRPTAIKVGATFAYTALADYDTVSLVLFNNDLVSAIPNLRGKGAFHLLVNQLENTTYEGESDLLQVVSKWQGKFRKGITIIVSDFMYDHKLDQVMALLNYRKQKVILCHVLSEEEINPAIEEHIKLVDSETGASMNIEAGPSAGYLYQQAFNKYSTHINSICKKYQGDYIRILAHQPIEVFIQQLSRY